ncbi:5-oxoprolinase subunit PxpA [Cellulophaga sp. HaHaR_3_176]|uniref:5-oxoprolinase subunit PxpA n=1 Tax=Cellulophaga sp. HaHaR_3_176 TaxID=1942464 RepID=UPI001C1F7FDE|nr:5-oxoprolinase subunit PxpA [Cellulophaga sp. HaHaR_3_176]QWX82668.1 5-oxoprolinase subunit PxpA [Cellulophaga sp. HaHaR_3_176]
MDRIFIDINSDVGEGVGNEALLLPLLSSCNIACGGHAGDNNSMRDIIQLAKKHTVLIGVHPSYPDKNNFGRLSIDIQHQHLITSIRDQITNFSEICKEEKAILNHIKPHGALYNDIAKDKKLALVFLEAILPHKNEIKLYVPYNSIIEKEALKQSFDIVYEAFLDRNYNDDLSLVARSKLNSLIQTPEKVLQHLLEMVKNEQVISVNDTSIKIKANTYCIHGDTSDALKILTYLHKELKNHFIAIKK